ncbi:hypothetical protein TNCV_3893951 [Trichonephila clavipes]|nr:hypothetical protein TNCV_3893951 [Trichonephila clavipes]
MVKSFLSLNPFDPTVRFNLGSSHSALPLFYLRPLLTSLEVFLDPVHIELASDLRSQAFIAALKRFMARRGKCAKLFSDNGKNFVGASNEIKKLLEIVRNPDENRGKEFREGSGNLFPRGRLILEVFGKRP